MVDKCRTCGSQVCDHYALKLTGMQKALKQIIGISMMTDVDTAEAHKKVKDVAQAALRAAGVRFKEEA